MSAATYPKPLPETLAEHLAEPFYVFSRGMYGHRSDWTAHRVSVSKVADEGRRLVVALETKTLKSPVPMRWSVSRVAYLVSSRMVPVSGELRYAHDPDVIYARKLACSRWLRKQTMPTGDVYGNPEDPTAYIERVREAATQAGTRLLRIEEGL